jgi:hypothetical protein
MKKAAWDFIFLGFATTSIVLFWKNTVLISIILAIIALARLIQADKMDRIFFAVIGIGASIVESVAIMSGAWMYSTRQILNMPSWIILYWGIGGIAINDVYLLLEKRVKK